MKSRGQSLTFLQAVSTSVVLAITGALVEGVGPGRLDQGFAPQALSDGQVESLLVQPDGKIVIGGAFSVVGGALRRGIARLEADGSLDPSFNPGRGAGGVLALARQADGKIVMGGRFDRVNDVPRSYIARLHADGSLDAGFNAGGGPDWNVRAIAVQPDGRVLIAGDFSFIGGITRNCIARLNADGSLDTSFNPGSGTNYRVFALVLQADGKVVIGGRFTRVGGSLRNHVARLNADGSVDKTFDPGNGPNMDVWAVTTQSDGKVVIAGLFSMIGSSITSRVARLNADGSLDTSFVPAWSDGDVESVVLQPDGKVLVGGRLPWIGGLPTGFIRRLNTDGSTDATFDPGSGASRDVRVIVPQLDGKVLLGGYFTTFNGVVRSAVARLNADGSLDGGTALPPILVAGGVHSFALQSDGGIIIAGGFNSVSGSRRGGMVRLNADGSLDTGFGLGDGANSRVEVLALQGDGKIVIAGYFTTFDGSPRSGMARLNADGSLDPSFEVASDGSPIGALALQPDGRILIGGDFRRIGDSFRGCIARLEPTGDLDTTFGDWGGANTVVKTIALQPDGKIVIGGWFTTVNGTPRNGVARLNADGSLDSGFAPGSGANDVVQKLSVRPDGKILLGGYFTSVNGTPRGGVARLDPDGSLDSSFDPGSGASAEVHALVVQPDGRVVLGGSFTSFDGFPRSRIARLNEDGSLDTSFNPGSGADFGVDSLALQPDGKILLGGGFTSIDGTPRYSVARLHGLPSFPEGCPGLPGDANGDVSVDVSDVFFLINSLFAGGPAPVGCGDANSDGEINVQDVFYLINDLFAGGPGLRAHLGPTDANGVRR